MSLLKIDKLRNNLALTFFLATEVLAIGIAIAWLVYISLFEHK